MKICQINCVYGIGSTGKIVRDIHHTLMIEGNESIVITPVKNQFTDEEGVFVTSNLFLSYSSAILRRSLCMTFDWAQIQTWRLIRILREQKPDIVHLHCINGNDINLYILHHYLAKHCIKTLYTLHAEFPYTGGCGNTMDCNRWKMGCGSCQNLKVGVQSPIIDRTHRTWNKQRMSYLEYNNKLLRFTAVSPWLMHQAEEAKMLDGFSKAIVLNGIDTNVFCYRQPSGIWRKKLSLKEHEKMILYVTASFAPYEVNLKGGRFILELAERMKTEPVKIVVAANYGQAENLPENVIYIGRTETQEDLAELYREANLCILTSKSETFGMPVAESLCCGTPVAGFKAGGPESIAISEYSDFVDYGDIESLYKRIERRLIEPTAPQQISKDAKAIYSREAMTQNYIKQYRNF